MARKQREIPKAKVLSLQEVMQKFPDEQAAIDYLTGILWKDGAVCPFCGGNRVSPRKVKNYHRCNDCKKDFTIRVGTIFHRSHIKLHLWLLAMYLIVTDRKGISSVELAKKLGISQVSAWFLLQRIRAACGNMTAKILSGIVEGDETFLGGKEKNKHASKKLKQGRGAVGKTTVFGMKDRDGQVMAKVVDSTSAEILQGEIKKNVLEGSTICTDQHSGYIGLDTDGKFVHKRVKHSAKQFVDGMAHTNGIESVWAILKRSFYGTFHWFSRTHTQLYLDEVVFRLNINEGNCRRDTVDRLQSLVRGVKGKRLTWKMLVHGI